MKICKPEIKYRPQLLSFNSGTGELTLGPDGNTVNVCSTVCQTQTYFMDMTFNDGVLEVTYLGEDGVPQVRSVSLDFITDPPTAINGLSLDNGDIVLGQEVGEAGDPAQLLSDREIPLNNFSLRFEGTGISGGSVSVGQFVSPILKFSVYDPEDITVNPSTSVRACHFAKEHRLLQDGITLTDCEGVFMSYVVRGMNTVNLNSQGGDLLQGARSSLSLRQVSGFTGDTVFDILGSTATDAISGHCAVASIQRNSPGTVTIEGFFAAYNSELVSGTGRTLENYVAYNACNIFNVGGVVNNVFGFYVRQDPNAGTNSNWGFFEETLAPNFMHGKVIIGGGLTGGTSGLPAIENDSAKLEINSTTQGFLPPRMTEVQRDAIVSPVAGLVVYNTDDNKLNVFTTVWEEISSS